jgi:hypothetical protein
MQLDAKHVVAASNANAGAEQERAYWRRIYSAVDRQNAASVLTQQTMRIFIKIASLRRLHDDPFCFVGHGVE